MTAFSEAIVRASRVVNATLGGTFTYHRENGDIVNDASIIIDRNKEVKDDHGFLAGYRVEASILKEEVPEIGDDHFISAKDETWSVNAVTRETTAKWYVDITLTGV